MSSIPFYDDFTTHAIDLEELMKALGFDFNYRYFDGPNYFLTGQRIRSFIEDRKRNGKPQVLTPDDGLIFNEYFAMKYVLLLNSEESFLRYHLETTFDKDMNAFRSMVEKVLRKYSEYFPQGSPKTELLKKYPNTAKLIKTDKYSEDYPGKRVLLNVNTVTRKGSDQMTSLPQLSTTAFFQYLRKEKIILGQEFINDSTLADVIQILTGYKGAMRTDVSRISYLKRDLDTLKSSLEKVIALIDKDLRRK
jgi:hypothetical protein